MTTHRKEVPISSRNSCTTEKEGPRIRVLDQRPIRSVVDARFVLRNRFPSVPWPRLCVATPIAPHAHVRITTHTLAKSVPQHLTRTHSHGNRNIAVFAYWMVV